MGVPSFYRWLVNKYPEIVVRAVEDERESSSANPNGIEFDNLYLDMNGIIHPCFHPEDQIFPPTSFEEVFDNMYEYIDRLFSVVRPRKLLYMAIDGVAPRAKMNQQRRRRFLTPKDNEIAKTEEDRLRKQYEIEGKPLLPKQESEVSDSNVITPGTVFMHEVSKVLRQYISSRMKHDAGWKDLKVILSDSNVPGEGEHKIMSFIRLQRRLPDYNPNCCHCLYGLDADLIMLALATHEVHVSILREDVFAQEQRERSSCDFKESRSSIKIPYQLLHVWILREYLELDMKISDLPGNLKEINFERIVDDFIFICFFVGNDFLPHMPSLEIHEGAIDLLMTVYKNEFMNIGGYMVDMERIADKKGGFFKLKRVEKFILLVGAYEEKIFKKRMALRDSKLRRLLSENSDVFMNGEEEQSSSLMVDSNNSGGLFPNRKARSSSSSAQNLATSSGTEALITDESELAILYAKEMKMRLKENIRAKSDLFRGDSLGTDRVRLGHPGWKERYYGEKFSCHTSQEIERTRKEIGQKYAEGLLWVLRYYFSGVPSWSWFYPYHYAPFASDFKGLSQVKVVFQKGSPFKPFDQLMCVLPPSSAHALPRAYQPFMLDDDSAIIDFYDTEFEVDTEGKQFTWQGICKLPFIDEARLLAVTRKVEMELEEQEAVRNSRSYDQLFMKFSDELHWFYMDQISSKPDKPPGSMLCGFPDGSVHVPRPLEGTIFPIKTISEADIQETLLWHEYKGARPLVKFRNHKGSEPAINRMKSNQANSVGVRKESGFGWSAGAARGSINSRGSSAVSVASGVRVAGASWRDRREDHYPLAPRCSRDLKSEMHSRYGFYQTNSTVVGLSRAQVQGGIQDLKISENRHGFASYGRGHQSTSNIWLPKHASAYDKSTNFGTTTGNGQNSNKSRRNSANVTVPYPGHISYAAAVTSIKPPAGQRQAFP